jgi:hypothetical protein
VREDFADLAYWSADLVSDADGRITFAVALPDNLTTWQMNGPSRDAQKLKSATLLTRSSPPKNCNCVRCCPAS